MSDHTRRLARLETVWSRPAPAGPGAEFDASRLTAGELAELVPLSHKVGRRPDGTWDFSRATDAELDRLDALVAKGMAR